jgi:hypothetical protein
MTFEDYLYEFIFLSVLLGCRLWMDRNDRRRIRVVLMARGNRGIRLSLRISSLFLGLFIFCPRFYDAAYTDSSGNERTSVYIASYGTVDVVKKKIRKAADDPVADPNVAALDELSDPEE